MTPETPSSALRERLLRFTQLKEIGPEGLERIARTRFLVVGAGGLGSPALTYLAASGASRILVADPDVVSASNLSRQLLHDPASIGTNKAVNAVHALARFNPDLTVEPIEARLEGEALDAAVARADVILDCSDNLATRHAVNRAACTARKPLVFGAAVRFSGQLSVFDFRREDSPCYRCLFPEDDAANDEKAAAFGVFSPLTGVVGVLQAGEALKIAAGIGSAYVGRLLLIDLLAGDFTTLGVRRKAACPVCGR